MTSARAMAWWGPSAASEAKVSGDPVGLHSFMSEAGPMGSVISYLHLLGTVLLW